MQIQEKITSREIVWAVCMLLAAAVVFTWPLAARIAAAIPRASEPAAVAFFQLFSCRWTAHALAQGGAGYWDPAFFYPLKGVFAWCEPQLLNCLIAWLFSAAGGSIVGYNLMLVFNIVLLGTAGYALARRLTADRTAALFCGLWLCCGAFALHQLCAPSLLAAGWPLLVVFAVVSYSLRPHRRYFWLATAAYLAAWFTSKQTAVYLTLFVPCMLLPLWAGPRKALHVLALMAAGAALAAVLIAPYAFLQFTLASKLGFTRASESVWAIADPRQLVMPATGHWIYRLLPADLYSWDVGVVVLIVIMLALARGWAVQNGFDHRKRKIIAGLLLLSAVSLIAASAGQFVPLQFVRTPERSAVFAISALPVIAAAAFAWLRGRMHSAGLRRVFSAGVFALLAAEMWTMPIALVSPLEESRGHQQIIEYLRSHDCQIPVLELPVRSGSAALEAAAMLRMLEHGHPLVNGYASFAPPQYLAFKKAWVSDPAGEGMRLVLAYQPGFVLAHLHLCTGKEVALLKESFSGRAVLGDNEHLLIAVEK